ncbi:methylated-DNA--[protein]-cysteine S-methyltransferase [Brachybacterium hainanense]|uniref:Methylated-DNA--protein-cysteine methyltransferase n=1 Tax=Brachybacterium hainanense TaxID=1541174 RepID=A0ABV6RGA9_9MICO
MSTPSIPRTDGSAPAPPRHLRIPTPLGIYVISAQGPAITGVWREDQAYFPTASRLGDPAGPGDELLAEARDQLLAYIAGQRERFELPLAPQGTAFQHQVWALLREIARGETTTYGELARRLGRPRAAQAVGRAVGTNPISILVPCHRVLASDGSLTGYAGGIETKRALLVLEGALEEQGALGL